MSDPQREVPEENLHETRAELPADTQAFEIVEELTAYLDGELDQDAIDRVEKRLGDDPNYLAEMQSLQQTWDVLDQLPMTEPGMSFTKTTMELVVGEATKSESKPKASWIWPFRVACLVAIPAALFVATYWLVQGYIVQPDRILVSNLTAIEHQNRYRYLAVDSQQLGQQDLDFLLELSRRGLFFRDTIQTDEVVLEQAESVLIPESIEDRETYVAETLDVDQKVQLQRKLDNFMQMSAEKRGDLVSFDRMVHEHDDREQLVSVLQSYSEWLEKLPAEKQAALMDLNHEDRLARIDSMLRRNALEYFGATARTELTESDINSVYAWYDGTLVSNGRMIRDRFTDLVLKNYESSGRKPSDRFKQAVKRLATHAPLAKLFSTLSKMDRDFSEDIFFQGGNVEVLQGLLSAKANEILDQRTPNRQRELVFQWIESANAAKSLPSIEELNEFRGKLTETEQIELNKLSTERYWATLQKKYRDHQRRKPRSSTMEDFESFLNQELRGYRSSRPFIPSTR